MLESVGESSSQQVAQHETVRESEQLAEIHHGTDSDQCKQAERPCGKEREPLALSASHNQTRTGVRKYAEQGDHRSRCSEHHTEHGAGEIDDRGPGVVSAD